MSAIVYVQTDLFSGNCFSYQKWLPWRCVFPQFVVSRNSYNYSFLCPLTVAQLLKEKESILVIIVKSDLLEDNTVVCAFGYLLEKKTINVSMPV